MPSRDTVSGSATDELVSNNRRYAATFEHGGLPASPRKKVAVLACMDARLDIYSMLGLGAGEAHVIRNAGGVATDDAIRSLVISQELLGTRAIVIIHHTNCGMTGFHDDELKERIYRATGIRPSFAFEAFSDAVEDVRQTIARLVASPFLSHKDAIRGFVYDVGTGRLDEVR